MNREQIGRLWESRFHKIMDTERDSLDFYRELSEKDELISESPRLREILEEILDDEERNSVISKELVRVVTRRIKMDKENETER